MKLELKDNVNYAAEIIKLGKIYPIAGADRIKYTLINFQSVIIGLDYKEGDICVYFPVESVINKDFLSYLNAFSNKELNKNKEVEGFFNDKGRVRAINLKSTKSYGYIVNLKLLSEFIGEDISESYLGTTFDYINGIKICEKYIIPTKQGTVNIKQGKNKKHSRLIDNQVYLHADTENFRKNLHKISYYDHISVTKKRHGTSGWCANVLVKRELSWFEKILKKFGVKLQETKYDLIYGSRKVIKNQYFDDSKQHYYGVDIWGQVVEENDLANKVLKGMTIYYEIIGFINKNTYIQPEYDYGITPGEHKILVYRITTVTPDGNVLDYNFNQIKEYCNFVGLETVPEIYVGQAGKMYDFIKNKGWEEWFLKKLEEDYTEKDDNLCVNKVPEEGVVIRKEKLFGFEAYKLKSFRFLDKETRLLDAGQLDIEEQ